MTSFTTPSTPLPSGPPAQHLQPPTPPPSGPKSGWRWRATVAAAVAGGVLAASVAVPATWALARTSGPATAGQGQTLVPTPPGGSTSTQRGSQGEATADQSQGVVLIDTRTTAGQAAGTGLVLDSAGVVLTNYHVVEGSTQIQVTVASTGDAYDATVVGHDQQADIALLQLDGASDLATVAIDDDGDPAVSDDVTAVGNAEGQGFLSASPGDVVALGQSIDTQSEGPVQGERLSGLIQTDAYVVGGYSGGALLDDEGEVVGITTAASDDGRSESYAVPIQRALNVAESIEDGDETGGIEVGPAAYLGIVISSAGSGVQVGQVESGGAAAEAGIEAGATITGIDDTAISSYDGLRRTLATYEPGDSVALQWTDASGSSHDAEVTLGESPVN